MKGTRLDELLVIRGLAESRSQAKALIMSGRVRRGTERLDKPGKELPPDTPLELDQPPRFVSRGGEKLAAALTHFALEVRGAHVLDVGASTGGFTDCLLQRGAREVVALDVGHGQLHPLIRNDERVKVIERFNVREMTIDDIGGPVDAVVADLSFISLTLVAARLVDVCREGGEIVVLVKPQFEVGRAEVSKGKGVVTDPVLWDEACRAVTEGFRAAGADPIDLMESPLLGGEGNKEFLLRAKVRGRLEP